MNRTLVIRPNDMRRCVGIVIFDDLMFEPDESFGLTVEGFGAFTNITILDDDGKLVNQCTV